MRFKLPVIKVLSSLVLMYSSVGHAIVLNTPTMPSTPAASPHPGVMVHPPLEFGGQWIDTYFPASPGGLTPAVVAATNCIVIHYHGGGFVGGDPRESGAANFESILPELVTAFVVGQGCIFASTSYSLKLPTDTNYNINGLLGAPNINKSVYGAFDALYTQILQPWMQSNPNIQLWTTGVSAGSVLSQRVATSGNWPISKTLLIGTTAKNARFFGANVPGTSVPIKDPLWSSCETRTNDPAGCATLRDVFDHNGIFWPNPSLDISYYAQSTPTNLETNVIINACDDVTDLGSWMRGYFNHIPAANRKISVWKGFTTTEMKNLSGLNPSSLQGVQHAFYKFIIQDYLNGTGGTNWAAYNASNLGDINNQYINYCQPTADPNPAASNSDTSTFRSFLIN